MGWPKYTEKCADKFHLSTGKNFRKSVVYFILLLTIVHVPLVQKWLVQVDAKSLGQCKEFQSLSCLLYLVTVPLSVMASCASQKWSIPDSSSYLHSFPMSPCGLDLKSKWKCLKLSGPPQLRLFIPQLYKGGLGKETGFSVFLYEINKQTLYWSNIRSSHGNVCSSKIW